MARYDGKTVIVTGGVSGIGDGTTRAFLAEGANVVSTCLPNEEAGKVMAAEFADNAKLMVIECDISNQQSVENLVQQTIKTYGKIDAFISNAAAFDGYKLLLDTSPELWKKVIDVNMNGNFYIAQAVLPHMIENGGGALVFISSIAGVIAGHGGAAYTASKHALIGLCKHITFHYGNQGIRCNSICPGSIYTPLSAPFLDLEPAKAKLAKTPHGTYGMPKDIANAALFLASEEASFIYGANLMVDGGNLIRKWD